MFCQSWANNEPSKVALVKTAKGSLQHTPENNIFLLKRAACRRGQVRSWTQVFLLGLEGQTEAVQPSGAQASWISKSLLLNNKHIFRHEIGFLRFEHSYMLRLTEGTHCKLIRRWLCKMDGRNPNELFFHALVLVCLPKSAFMKLNSFL